MAKLLKNDRKLIKKGDKYIFILKQEQEYDAEAKTKIVEDWNKELADKELWLKNKDAHIAQMVQAGTEQINHMAGQIEKDIEALKEALKIWEEV